MTREQRNDLYKRAIEKWGEEAQFDQMIEEMGELIVAFNKFRRAKNYKQQDMQSAIDNLFEEIADVKLCVEQMEWIFGKEQIDNVLQNKLEKFIKQLNS